MNPFLKKLLLLGITALVAYLMLQGQWFFLLFIVLITATVAAHEAGHAYFMRKHGIEIREFGIGIGPVGKPMFYLPLRKICLPFLKMDVPPIAFHPLLLGAYVAPTEKGEADLATLPLKAKLEIFGGGVYANIIVATGIFACLFLWVSIVALTKSIPLPAEVIIKTIGSLVLLVFLVRFRRTLAAWSPPFLAALMISILWITFTTPGASEALVGPVGIMTMGAQTTSLFDVLALIFAISLSLALFNALPIPPLDGGHMLTAILATLRVPKRLIVTIEKTGLILFLLFVVYVIGNDILKMLA